MLSCVSHSSKFMEPKQGVVGTSDLQPVPAGQKHGSRPGLTWHLKWRMASWGGALWGLVLSLGGWCQNGAEWQNTQLGSENLPQVCGLPRPLPPPPATFESVTRGCSLIRMCTSVYREELRPRDET